MESSDSMKIKKILLKCSPVFEKMDASIQNLYAQKLSEAMEFCGITTPKEIAAFLAQILLECGELRWFKELCPGNYEDREDLGNIYPGDGKKYIGRGAIQITGRVNYELIGQELGINLLDNPEIAETADYAFLVSATWWRLNKMNEICDSTEESFRKVTLRVNGGYNGYEARKKFWVAIKKEMGI